jgi:hypothetical protein
MKTRIGKIAQLPKTIREELNRRLEDGLQGPELLPWLNSLPATKNVLARQFAGKPVTKCNLSDWRQGGYQDWLRLQGREKCIQRVAEQGVALERREGNTDLFECFSRMVIADLAFDLDSLSAITDSDERWKRLRELSRELARLQNGYNHSRRAALAWEKWRRKTDLEDTPCETGETLHSDNHASQQSQQPIPAAPHRPHETKYRTIYFTRCHCVCRQCHPADGEYPYWEAEKDHAESKKTRLEWLERDRESIHVAHGDCDCTCDACEIRHAEWASRTAENQGPENSTLNPARPPGSVVPNRAESRRTVHKIIHHTKCNCGNICPKCHPSDGEYPPAQAEADIAELRKSKIGFVRRDKSISISLRSSFCACVCEECARAENQPPAAHIPKSPEPAAFYSSHPSPPPREPAT